MQTISVVSRLPDLIAVIPRKNSRIFVFVKKIICYQYITNYMAPAMVRRFRYGREAEGRPGSTESALTNFWASNKENDYKLADDERTRISDTVINTPFEGGRMASFPDCRSRGIVPVYPGPVDDDGVDGTWPCAEYTPRDWSSGMEPPTNGDVSVVFARVVDLLRRWLPPIVLPGSGPERLRQAIRLAAFHPESELVRVA